MERLCDILCVTGDCSVILDDVAPCMEVRNNRVCAMLLVRGLRCDARQRCLRLDGHITLFYVNNAERVTQKRRSEWMTYVYGWVLRMQSRWESVASTRLIPYWEESSATYGIMDLDIITPLYNTLTSWWQTPLSSGG